MDLACIYLMVHSQVSYPSCSTVAALQVWWRRLSPQVPCSLTCNPLQTLLAAGVQALEEVGPRDYFSRFTFKASRNQRCLKDAGIVLKRCRCPGRGGVDGVTYSGHLGTSRRELLEPISWHQVKMPGNRCICLRERPCPGC